MTEEESAELVIKGPEVEELEGFEVSLLGSGELVTEAVSRTDDAVAEV